jgi:Domain of unknown function (DUF4263)
MENGSQTTPRFAYLGFCDRAETITKGHHAFWHDNVIGLARSRVFHFLPVNLRDQKIVTAVFQPRSGDRFRILFRCSAAQKEFEIVFEISGISASTRPDASKPAEHAEVDTTFDGWVFQVNRVDFDVFVFEAGIYKVYLSEGESEVCLGEVSITGLGLPPFTQDDIAAIRSNPFGKKLVRVEFKCKICHEALRAYAGLERSASLEADGWIWNLDITSDRFRCNCGTNDFSLAPIKNGLHGLLRENFGTQRDSSTSSIFNSVRLYEDSALQEHCRQFQELIESDPPEEKVQKFLENHEIFFSVFVPQKLMVKSPVLTKYFVDFAILNERKELLLIEIERPGLRLLRADGVITAELQHAFSQVQDWFRIFDDHRAAALDAWQLRLDDVANVRGVVIAGRTPINEVEDRRLRSHSLSEIDLYTYDDLLRGVAAVIRHVANA